MFMMDFITLPGIGGSGASHWQTLWEAGGEDFRRFAPSSWDEPQLDDWIRALDDAVASAQQPPVLVAHSLACLLVVHWQSRSMLPVAGAMLVAVPDPLVSAFPAAAASFADPPERQLRFPSLIVASGNDPYGTLRYAERRAGQWGSRMVEAGDLGHVNAASGLGAWPAGRAMLSDFMQRLPVA
jgi:predicted alpha/beta hydrolase family esterase